MACIPSDLEPLRIPSKFCYNRTQFQTTVSLSVPISRKQTFFPPLNQELSGNEDGVSFPQKTHSIQVLEKSCPQGRSALLDSIKACGRSKDLHNARRIHADIIQRGLHQKDVCISNALISMYTSVGDLAKAQEMFDELPAPSIVSWNALISGYAQHGRYCEALYFFTQMREKGFSPNAITFTCALKACGSKGLARNGEELHNEIRKKGLLERNVVLGTALVDMYVKSGALGKAQEVFDELPTRNIVTWNALLRGFVQHGFNDEALRCFTRVQQEGFSPDAVTFVCMAKACGAVKTLEKGEVLYAEAIKQGLLEEDVILGNAFIDMFAKCGHLQRAEKVFKDLRSRNVVSWTTLIVGYVNNGFCQEAIGCFMKMCAEGVSPDSVTLTCILKACGALKLIEMGEEICVEINKWGLSNNDLVLCTALVDMYVSCGMLTKGRRVFDNLKEPDIVAWTVLIDGYTQEGNNDKALNCFRQMQERGVTPDMTIFASILRACSADGLTAKGNFVHATIRKQGLEEEIDVLRNALVDMYAKHGALVKAKQVLDELSSRRDVISWNALLTGYAQQGYFTEAIILLDQMVADGIAPNSVTLLVMLSMCSHAGLVQEGQRCFDSFTMAFSLNPTLEHYTCLVDLYGRAGHFDKAMVVIEKVAYFESFQLWVSFLASCQRWENVELGRWAFEHLVHLNKDYGAAYVCMNNLYAAACMQKDAQTE